MADMDEMIMEISVFSFRIIISAEPFTEHTHTHTQFVAWQLLWFLTESSVTGFYTVFSN